MRKFGRWMIRKATQGLAWIAAKIGQAIIFVVDGVAAVVEVVKEKAKVLAEVTVEIVNRVRKSPIFQNIRKGLNIMRKFRDLKEFPKTARHLGEAFWAFVTGKACFSWVATSGWCTLCSLGYAALLLAGFTFSLYLLGLLSTAFRS